jgi:hypothetical protein
MEMPLQTTAMLVYNKLRFVVGYVQVGSLAVCEAGLQVWKSHREVKQHGGMSRRCCTATEYATGLRGLPPRLRYPSLPQTGLHTPSYLFYRLLCLITQLLCLSTTSYHRSRSDLPSLSESH